eukprot:355348-Chlamydomonas_euryale.AAC.3
MPVPHAAGTLAAGAIAAGVHAAGPLVAGIVTAGTHAAGPSCRALVPKTVPVRRLRHLGAHAALWHTPQFYPVCPHQAFSHPCIHMQLGGHLCVPKGA